MCQLIKGVVHNNPNAIIWVEGDPTYTGQLIHPQETLDLFSEIFYSTGNLPY